MKSFTMISPQNTPVKSIQAIALRDGDRVDMLEKGFCTVAHWTMYHQHQIKIFWVDGDFSIVSTIAALWIEDKQ